MRDEAVDRQIVVLVKQVPATTDIAVDPVTHNIIREGARSVVNPYDLYALEEALVLSERTGMPVVAVTMGPVQALNALQYCLSLGVHRALLLSDRAFAGSDTWATALVLAAALRQLNATLVLCGKMAADGDTAQVPPQLAERLGFPCVTRIARVLDLERDGSARVMRRTGGEEVELVVSLPAVLTVDKGVNSPRYPTLEGVATAAAREVAVLGAADLGIDTAEVGTVGSPTRVVKVQPAHTRKKARMLQGSLDAQLTQVIGLLTMAEEPGDDRGV